MADNRPSSPCRHQAPQHAGGDLLTSYDGAPITYDAMGNPESYLGKTLSWEGKQLVSVAGERPNSSTYVYNEDGLRLRKTVNGTDTEYYYNGSATMSIIYLLLP